MIFLIFLPFLIEISLVIIIGLIITFIFFIILKKKLLHEKLSENHTVASYFFNAFSLSYCVLLTFLVYANWLNYDRAQQNVYYETSYLSNFYRDTRFLPDSLKPIVSEKIIKYTKTVIEDEWIKFSKGNTSTLTDTALNDLYYTYINIPLALIPNPYLYQVSLDKLNSLSQYRRLRILDMKQTIPSVLWGVLFICFLVSSGYAYFFTTKGKKVHLLLITSFIVTNILIFYLIYVLDHPYVGYSSISSEPFQLLLNKFLLGN